MKTLNVEKLVVLAIAAYAAAGTGCSMMPGGQNAATVSTTTETTGGTTTATSISTTVANVDNVAIRIQNALTLPTPNPSASPNPSLVSPLTGNFATVVAQQGPNLSTTTDPATASGAGAIPLLAYAACNDVKATSYGVTTTGTITAQGPAIVAAGMTIVNQCTANLAATGTSMNSPAAAIFTTLVSQDSTAGATTAQAFISVCTAATSFCVSMLSF